VGRSCGEVVDHLGLRLVVSSTVQGWSSVDRLASVDALDVSARLLSRHLS
jgi:hypothetical protein